MTNSDTPNYTPDPTWDYYIIWHKCIRAKAKIDQAISLMNQYENSNKGCDRDCNELISDVFYELESIDFEIEDDNED